MIAALSRDPTGKTPRCSPYVSGECDLHPLQSHRPTILPKPSTCYSYHLLVASNNTQVRRKTNHTLAISQLRARESSTPAPTFLVKWPLQWNNFIIVSNLFTGVSNFCQPCATSSQWKIPKGLSLNLAGVQPLVALRYRQAPRPPLNTPIVLSARTATCLGRCCHA